MRRSVTVLVLSCALLAAAPARAQAPQAPPEIQAILDKQKRGEPLTAEDLQKLMAWGQALSRKFAPSTPVPPPATPGAGPSAEAIAGVPVRLDVHLSYTLKKTHAGKFPQSYDDPQRGDPHHKSVKMVEGTSTETTTVELSGSADLTMRGAPSGSDDYMKSLLDPSAHASMFTFTPKIEGMRAEPKGGGSYRYEWVSEVPYDPGTTRNRIVGTLSQCSAGFVLVTRGGDAMSPMGNAGDFGGRLDGTGFNSTEPGVGKAHSGSHPVVGEAPRTDVSVLFPLEQKDGVRKDGTTPPPHAQISYKMITDAIASGRAASVPWTEAFDIDLGKDASAKGTTKVMLTFRPDAETVLAIGPADREAYESWVPVPAADAADAKIFGEAKPVAILAKLQKGRAESAPPATVPSRIYFFLMDLSQLRGTCTNYPVDAAKDEDAPRKNDLRFSKTQPDYIVLDDDLHCHTVGATLAAVVMVEATDTAGYGDVVAEAPDLDHLKSYCAYTTKDGIDVPYDPDGDHIAYAWKKQMNCLLEEATSDAEPQNDQRESGDGLTLFEEYRGFVELENHGTDTYNVHKYKHVRTNPKRKDVFCFDADAMVLKYYFPENPADLDWHFVDPQTVRITGNPNDLDTRRVNVNTPPQYRYGWQYAIQVSRSDLSYKNASLVTPQGLRDGNPDGNAIFGWAGVSYMRDDLAPFSDDNPQSTNKASLFDWYHPDSPIHAFKYIMVYQANVRDLYARCMIPPDSGAPWHGPGAQATLDGFVERDVKISTMHEVGHSLGVHHHDTSDHDGADKYYGCPNCVMCYGGPDQTKMVFQGIVPPTPVRYCRKNDTAIDRNGNRYPGDDCWGQITVKSH
jgi:hypothetical protein